MGRALGNFIKCFSAAMVYGYVRDVLTFWRDDEILKSKLAMMSIIYIKMISKRLGHTAGSVRGAYGF